MPSPEPPPRVRASYLRSALATPANKTSVLVTALVVLAVFLYARVPLGPGFEVDLRAEGLDAPAAVTLVGFGESSAAGRRPAEAGARVVLNRPLPAHFTLLLEGRSEAASARSHFQVGIGRQRYALTFRPALGVEAVEVENPDAAREIVFFAAEGVGEGKHEAAPAIALRRLTLQ